MQRPHCLAEQTLQEQSIGDRLSPLMLCEPWHDPRWAISNSCQSDFLQQRLLLDFWSRGKYEVIGNEILQRIHSSGFRLLQGNFLGSSTLRRNFFVIDERYQASSEGERSVSNGEACKNAPSSNESHLEQS